MNKFTVLNLTARCSSRWLCVGVGIIALLPAVWILVQALHCGIIVVGDAPGYFRMAQIFVREHTLYTDLWAPGYPALLAVLISIGFNVTHAASVVSLTAFVMSAVLVMLLAQTVCDRRLAGVILGMLLIMSSTTVLDAHRFALSEPLFLMLYLAGMLAVAGYFHSAKTRYLMLAGLLAGAFVWVRYAGVLFVPAIALAPFLPGEKSFKKRVVDFLGVLAVIALFVLLLKAVVFFEREGATSRPSFAWHLVSMQHLKQLGTTVCGWIFPSSLVLKSNWLHFAGMSLAVCLPVIIFFKARHRKVFISWLSLQAFIYLSGLFLVVSVADHNVPFDARLMLYYYIAISICLLSYFLETRRKSWGKVCRLVFFAACILSGIRGVRYMHQVSRVPGGFNTEAWRAEPVLGFVKSAPAEWSFMSNQPAGLRFLTNRDITAYPRHYNAMTACAQNNMVEIKNYE